MENAFGIFSRYCYTYHGTLQSLPENADSTDFATCILDREIKARYCKFCKCSKHFLQIYQTKEKVPTKVLSK